MAYNRFADDDLRDLPQLPLTVHLEPRLMMFLADTAHSYAGNVDAVVNSLCLVGAYYQARANGKRAEELAVLGVIREMCLTDAAWADFVCKHGHGSAEVDDAVASIP